MPLKKAIFSFKVKVKVTRPFTWVFFERVSLVEYMKSISLTVQKLYSECLSWQQTDRQTERQTNKQTGQKQYDPIIRYGGINM